MKREDFKKMLRSRGLKVTVQRLLVLETIASRPGQHLTAEEIYELARQEYPEIGLATIYRTVQVLMDMHMIDRVNFNDGFARYELAETGAREKHNHHHAICQGCGTVMPFEDDLLDNLEKTICKRTGFQVTNHEVKLYGLCKKCLEKRKKIEHRESESGNGDN